MNQLQNPKLRFFLFLLAPALIWGTQSTVNSVLLGRGFISPQLTALRTLISAAVTGGYLLVSGGFCTPLHGRDLARFFIMGTVGLFGMNVLCIQSLPYLGVPVAMAFTYTSPVFVLLFSAALFHERITPRKMLAVALVVLGCFTANGALSRETNAPAAGILLALGSALCYAFYTILSRVCMKRFSAMETTFYAMAGACPASLLALLEQPQEKALFSDFSTVLLLIYIGVFCGCIAFILYGEGIRAYGSSVSIMFNTLTLPVSALVSRLVRQEPITLYKASGLLLIVIAVSLMQAHPQKRR